MAPGEGTYCRGTPMLTCQRRLFSLPDGMHYLNCAQFSPLLKSVEEAGIAGLRNKSVPTRIQPPDFFADVETLRGLLGRLINTSAERIALIPAVSYGMAIAARNVPLRAGQNVVLAAEEFPSNVYGWRERCREVGAMVRTVPRPLNVKHPARAWSDALVAAIDRETAAVSLSSVHWTDGTRFDLAAIGRRAREVGACFIVDGTQSVGALPFDFAQVQPDLLVCAGYKWLLGPYQCGFAAFGDRLIGGTPLEHNWITRENSQDFARLIDYRDGFQPGARRFDVGERSNFITVPMLSAAVRQILDWGVEAIQQYCAGLQPVLDQALGESPFAIASSEDRAAHMFGIRLPSEAAARSAAIVEELRRRNVHVSLRGTSIRVSPHVYNTPEDMAALAEALLAAAR
jgi:selenocysteine lyase/cysteine desulfurase